MLEIQLENLNSELQNDEIISDYIRLSEIQKKIAEADEALISAMDEWENAEIALNEIS